MVFRPLEYEIPLIYSYYILLFPWEKVKIHGCCVARHMVKSSVAGKSIKPLTWRSAKPPFGVQFFITPKLASKMKIKQPFIHFSLFYQTTIKNRKKKPFFHQNNHSLIKKNRKQCLIQTRALAGERMGK